MQHVAPELAGGDLPFVVRKTLSRLQSASCLISMLILTLNSGRFPALHHVDVEKERSQHCYPAPRDGDGFGGNVLAVTVKKRST